MLDGNGLPHAATAVGEAVGTAVGIGVALGVGNGVAVGAAVGAVVGVAVGKAAGVAVAVAGALGVADAPAICEGELLGDAAVGGLDVAAADALGVARGPAVTMVAGVAVGTEAVGALEATGVAVALNSLPTIGATGAPDDEHPHTRLVVRKSAHELARERNAGIGTLLTARSAG